MAGFTGPAFPGFFILFDLVLHGGGVVDRCLKDHWEYVN